MLAYPQTSPSGDSDIQTRKINRQKHWIKSPLFFQPPCEVCPIQLLPCGVSETFGERTKEVRPSFNEAHWEHRIQKSWGFSWSEKEGVVFHLCLKLCVLQRELCCQRNQGTAVGRENKTCAIVGVSKPRCLPLTKVPSDEQKPGLLEIYRSKGLTFKQMWKKKKTFSRAVLAMLFWHHCINIGNIWLFRIYSFILKINSFVNHRFSVLAHILDLYFALHSEKL